DCSAMRIAACLEPAIERKRQVVNVKPHVHVEVAGPRYCLAAWRSRRKRDDSACGAHHGGRIRYTVYRHTNVICRLRYNALIRGRRARYRGQLGQLEFGRYPVACADGFVVCAMVSPVLVQEC